MSDKLEKPTSASVPVPRKRGSATLAKTITGLKSPVGDPSQPVDVPAVPNVPEAPVAIDAAKLLKAWSLNVETMKALIEHMDDIKLDNAKTRDDAKTTRRITVGSTAMVFVLAMGGMVRLDSAIEQVQVLSVTSKATAEGVKNVHNQLGSVLAAVMAATSAGVEADIAEHVAQLEAAAAPKPRGRRHAQLAATVRLHKPSMTALKAKLEAQAVAIQAEAVLAKAAGTIPEQKAHVAVVQRKARALRKQAHSLKISTTGDSPLAELEGL